MRISLPATLLITGLALICPVCTPTTAAAEEIVTDVQDTQAVTIKAKVIDVVFVDDLYEDGTFDAWEEIECETMSEGKIKKIKIINNIDDREYKIEKNQVLLITIKGTPAISETDFVVTGNMILHLEILEN